ncbi:MAG: KEOPS complex kinase/ATPase Bud32 [Candidatus Micrarchaeaceae archaeon]
MKKIGEGAEAVIYSGKIYGKEVIVKYRAPKRYRVAELDTTIRKGRTRKEAMVIARAIDAGVNVPMLIGLGAYEIYMEYIRGTALKDVEATKAIMAMAGVQLGRLHNAGISHGDFTPANIITKGKNVYVIDFGLAEITESSEERALDLLLMKRQVSASLNRAFLSGYTKNSSSSRDVLRRLSEIEERGRYQIRTLA